jgi:hypothetical protein
VRPAVLNRTSLVPQKSQELVLELKSAVIRADGKFQVLHGVDATAFPGLMAKS